MKLSVDRLWFVCTIQNTNTNTNTMQVGDQGHGFNRPILDSNVCIPFIHPSHSTCFDYDPAGLHIGSYKPEPVVLEIGYVLTTMLFQENKRILYIQWKVPYVWSLCAGILRSMHLMRKKGHPMEVKELAWVVTLLTSIRQAGCFDY